MKTFLHNYQFDEEYNNLHLKYHNNINHLNDDFNEWPNKDNDLNQNKKRIYQFSNKINTLTYQRDHVLES